MKKIILSILFISNLSYSQNRYSQTTTSSYTPMTLSEMMVVPQNLSNKYNENQKYLYSLKNWILELKPQVTEQSFLDRFNAEYNDLVKIEDKDLSKATKYLQQTENAIREIISDYNIWVKQQNSAQNNTTNNQTNTQNNVDYGSLAIKYYNEKDYPKAIINLSKYLEIDKNNTDALFYRAMAKSELNEVTIYKFAEKNFIFPFLLQLTSYICHNKTRKLCSIKK